MKQRNTKFLFLVFVLIFIIIYALASSFLRLKSYNFLNKLIIDKKIPSDNIVLIVTDDKSLNEMGRWPWKREFYLEVMDFFENYTQAKLIGFDSLVMAPDYEHPESDKKFFSEVSKFKKLTAGYAFSNDEFAKDINKDEYNNRLKEKTSIKIIDKTSKKNPIKATAKSFTVLQKTYFKNVNDIAALDVTLDSDGYIRRTSQLIKYNDELYPSLALSMYSKYTGIKEYILTDNYLYGFSDKYTLKIPVENDKGYITNYICYYKTNDGTYSHKKYSTSDIIKSYRAIKAGKKSIINPDEFKDKIIFFGANANAQALNDVVRTPISENFAGLDIKATNFDNLIQNKFFIMPNKYYNILTCIFIFVLIFVFAVYMPILKALLSSVAVMILYFIFAGFMFYNQIALDLILPELFVIVALSCAYSYKYLMEDDKKIKMQKAMGKYLSNEVMERVVSNIDNIQLGGKREDITVLFADIRNFTSISESMEADSVTLILNEYFSATVPIIEEHNGILNKFMGDAILAIFSNKNTNHALDAIRCADKMIKKVKVLQEKWLEEGKPRIEIGIGISSGEAFLGNIGSQDRLEYAVIGDTVNTASRIENYNKVYKTNFLISEATYIRVKNYVDVIAINNVLIRGKANRINLYEVVRVNK